MRHEADLQQWKALYENTTKIKELKPWEQFYDSQLIGISKEGSDDITFYSILGSYDTCYGVVVYEGLEGLNCFLLIQAQNILKLPFEYVMGNQKNLVCYWGNRDELMNEQRKIIKDLGYKYRGKNQWLYFLSIMPGYSPYNMDQDEVLRMSEYMENLEIALKCYNEEKDPIDIESGNMYHVVLDQDKKIVSHSEESLPFTMYRYEALSISDQELLSDLKKARKTKDVLEANVAMFPGGMKDDNYDRPISPTMVLLGDSNKKMIVGNKMIGPNEDPITVLSNLLGKHILQHGAPKEVRISNVIVGAGISEVCEQCGIKLNSVKRLRVLDDFVVGLYRFLQG